MSVPQGCDVSYCQTGVDYGELRKAGVQFSWIKGLDWAPKGFFWDGMHAKHKAGFRAAGVVTGDYCFGHITPDPIVMADEFTKQCSIDELPPVLDMETMKDGKIPAIAGPWALTFLTRLEQNLGVTPVLYSFTAYLTVIAKQAPGLARFPVWIAEYHNPPSPDHIPHLPFPFMQEKLVAYQFTGSGRLPGCPTTIDRDVLVRPIDEILVSCPSSSTSAGPVSEYFGEPSKQTQT